MSTIGNALERNSGLENLTVGERIGLFMSEIKTGITAINVKTFSSSIHVINTGNLFPRLKEKNNYFSLSTNFIPAPLYFDPKKQSFREYVSTCVNVSGAIKVTTDEVKTVYRALKIAAVTGDVPFSLRESPHEKLMGDLGIKLDDVFQNTGKATRQLSVLYRSFTDAEETFKLYNDNLAELTARDPELLVQYVSDLTSLVKVIRDKIEKNDVIYNASQVDTMEQALKRVDRLVMYCGRLLSLCNELTRVLELQVAYFEKNKN